MTIKPKDPEQLEFSTEKIEIPIISEDQFLIQGQLTAIELEKLRGRVQDREERKKYAKHIFRFIWIWCAGIFVLMVCNGFGWFKFDNSVIITLITTTTANILALFVIVANYLFYRDKKNGSPASVLKKKKKEKLSS